MSGNTRISIVLIIGIVAYIIFLNQQVPFCIPSEPVEQIQEEPTTVSSTEVTTLETEISQGPLVFNSVGDSMYPTIKDQSKCLCVKKSGYDVGDIVVYFMKINGDFQGIGHRIIRVDGEDITTKGDNNLINDQPIKENNILCHIPMVKRKDIK